jgi:hypothetical protein
MTSGNANKNLCYVSNPMSRTQASQYCTSQGMKLYTISNQDDLDLMVEFMKYWLNSYSVKIQINGEFINGAWSLSDPVAPLFSGAIPTFSNGSCLMIVNNFTTVFSTRDGFNPVFTTGAPCDDAPFACEYGECIIESLRIN